jgi:hypothetical protein
MNDRDVIDAFVAYLKEQGNPGLKVDRRPDDENQDSPDIDAIAGPFAIEHTSIDTLANQRRNSDWFMQVTGGLEDDCSRKLSFRLNVTLQYHAITKGQDWAAVRQALKSWINERAPGLADGLHVLDNVPGIPFRLHVWKASSRPPRVVFSRIEPDDNSLSHRIREQFDRKAKKLEKYHASYTTVLLVESDDIALMNAPKMLEAIQTAYPFGLAPGVDEIWYADTSIINDIEFMHLTPHVGQLRRPTNPSSGRS